MADEPDSIVLAHLREIRTQIDAINQRLERIETVRLERMEVNSLKAYKTFLGHRSMMERTVADYDGDLADLKRRVRRLEDSAL
jgi:hypothetical protein